MEPGRKTELFLPFRTNGQSHNLFWAKKKSPEENGSAPS
jgi:hypothetical protein